jgi:single-strand DNA-binding protein
MPSNTTVNRVLLLGNIIDEPVLVQKNNKQTLCFTLTTSEEIRKGETLLEHVEKHHIVAPGGMPENISVQKGAWVYIQGKIRTRVVFEDGVKLYKTEILATTIEVVKAVQLQL